MNYFAYGTNLNLDQMKVRCPNIKIIKMVLLKDFTLYFTSRSIPSIKYEDNAETWGVLFDIDKSCENSLDKYEGFPTLYLKKNIEVIDKDGGKFDCFAYVANEVQEGKPGRQYLEKLLAGAVQNNLPEDYIEQIKEKYGQ